MDHNQQTLKKEKKNMIILIWTNILVKELFRK